MKRLCELRKENRLNQIKLATMLNVSQKMISAYENGKNEPSIHTLKSIAKIFNTSIDYLTELTDIREPIDMIHETSLNLDEIELINIFKKLNKEHKLIAKGILIGLSNNTQNKE